MLQQFEYTTSKLINWWITEKSVFKSRKRGRLDATLRARVNLLVVYITWLLVIFAGGAISFYLGSLVFIGVSYVLANLIGFIALVVFNPLFKKFVVSPREVKEIAAAHRKLENMKAVKIAVLGSYGKTSMKDMLATVLSESKVTYATPGNKNVLISHARWINKIEDTAEVLIFEYGEGEPGDIARLAAFSRPDIAVITGLAPAHLDSYKDLDEIVEDFYSITEYVDTKNIYVNGSDRLLKAKFQSANIYQGKQLDNLLVENVKLDFNGVTLKVKDEDGAVQYRSGLMGMHQVGPILAVIAIAKKIGIPQEAIIKGIASTKPFEHRMQPRNVAGAWIIDDTYNGNIVGMQAGLDLLMTLPAKRHIYVTPGLVDQGELTVSVHEDLGSKIAKAQPELVVLMKNSVTDYIRSGLEAAAFKGELQIVDDPLEYYVNLEHFLVSGDVVMMQNDWPDSYK